MARPAKALIRYDGPALSDHAMDVQDLAPALLALGEMCRAANDVINGGMTKVNLQVRADVEQQCFQLLFMLDMSFIDQMAQMMEGERVQNAAYILKMLGIFVTPVGVAGGGLFAFLKWRSRKESEGMKFKVEGDGNTVVYIAPGGDTHEVTRDLHKIIQRPEIIDSAKRVLKPVADNPGYEVLEFENEKGVKTSFVGKEDAKAIRSLSSDMAVDNDPAENIARVRTVVRVRKAVLVGEEMWGITFNKAVLAKMLDTEWLAEAQSGKVTFMGGTMLDVDLVITTPIDEDGIANGPARYEIVKVYEVIQPTETGGLFED